MSCLFNGVSSCFCLFLFVEMSFMFFFCANFISVVSWLVGISIITDFFFSFFFLLFTRLFILVYLFWFIYVFVCSVSSICYCCYCCLLLYFFCFGFIVYIIMWRLLLIVLFVFLLVFVQVDFFLRKIFLWLYGCLYLFFLAVCLFDCRIVFLNIFQIYNCVLECG